jgi:hypothetical protein
MFSKKQGAEYLILIGLIVNLAQFKYNKSPNFTLKPTRKKRHCGGVRE